MCSRGDSMKTFSDLRAEAEADEGYWAERAALSFLAQLTELMQSEHVTKAELAGRLGTSKAYLSKVFNGSPNFTVATMVRLARAVGGDVEIRVTPRATTTATIRRQARRS